MDKKIMQKFEDFMARYGDQSNVIRIGATPQDLIGIGTEYLVVGNQVIAKFFNGDIVRSSLTSQALKNEDATKTAA